MQPPPLDPLSSRRIQIAFAVAIIADVLQFPVTAVTATGLLAIPGELADLLVDGVAMVVISRQLGFHWVLLPSLFVEVIPGLDLIPTWTGAVAFLVWQRNKQPAAITSPTPRPVASTHAPPGNAGGTHGPIIEAELVQPQQQPSAASQSDVDKRLERLLRLKQQRTITDEEYMAKRRQILDEL